MIIKHVRFYLLILFLWPLIAVSAGLQALNNDELQAVEGQAGADLRLKLSLNQKLDGQFDNVMCSNPGYCHIAISLNKRFVKPGNNGTFIPDSNEGNKLWLVWKAVQGSVNIQKLGLDGIDLKYRNSSNVEIVKPSILVSFTAAEPIQIRNFGYEALSIERDNFTSSVNIHGGSSNEQDYAYLKNTRYSNNQSDFNNRTSSPYDAGKQTGFTGLKMNGNLAINGRLAIFSCNGNHPRC